MLTSLKEKELGAMRRGNAADLCRKMVEYLDRCSADLHKRMDGEPLDVILRNQQGASQAINDLRKLILTIYKQ